MPAPSGFPRVGNRRGLPGVFTKVTGTDAFSISTGQCEGGAWRSPCSTFCVLPDRSDKPARPIGELSREGGVDGRMNSTQYLYAASVRRWVPCLAGGAALLVAGCSHRPIVVQTPAPTVIQTPPAATTEAAPAPTPPAVIVVNQAPPAPLQDTMPPQPSPQHVWIPGYWAWRNNQQQWITGHWEIPPHPGATWVEPRWEQRGSEYVFIDGYWQ